LHGLGGKRKERKKLISREESRDTCDDGITRRKPLKGSAHALVGFDHTGEIIQTTSKREGGSQGPAQPTEEVHAAYLITKDILPGSGT